MIYRTLFVFIRVCPLCLNVYLFLSFVCQFAFLSISSVLGLWVSLTFYLNKANQFLAFYFSCFSVISYLLMADSSLLKDKNCWWYYLVKSINFELMSLLIDLMLSMTWFFSVSYSVRRFASFFNYKISSFNCLEEVEERIDDFLSLLIIALSWLFYSEIYTTCFFNCDSYCSVL